ncbi:MAG: c-type cytochrome [Parvularculaceae bacterium]
MRVLIKVVSFGLFLTLVFTAVTNFLPQVQGEPPEETTVDIGSLTMDDFVRLGEELFKSKGTCALCHNNLGRAPDLLAMNVVDVAASRIAAEGYEGDATDAVGYLRESMKRPSAYVAPGFGKAGSNDRESPMPPVDQAPIELSELEMDAIIAFLESKDGHEVTVALPSEPATPASEPDDGSSAPTGRPAAAASVAEIMTNYGCTACHSLLDSEADIGPDLRTVGARLSAEEIRQSIIDPMAMIAEGYEPMMPDYFVDEMTIKELEAIVQYLASQTG